jgi:hypothetical protein
MENKNSFFVLKINLPDNKITNEIFASKIKNSVDLILDSMGVDEDPKEFNKVDHSRLIYFFKTNKRRRKGQLVKFCQRYLPEEVEYETEGITKAFLDEQIIRLKHNENFITQQNSKNQMQYKGEDIKILNDKKNWKPWQLKMLETFFNDDMSFKPPRPRTIYSLVDIEGQSGKSIFFKWLIVNIGEEKIGTITFGTASQLRSSIIHLGVKRMYILDLPRTKGVHDDEEDLMLILKSIVDGMVFSPKYGKAASLIMEPPHILITSSYLLDYESVSMDIWKVYEINIDGTLGIENEIFKDKEKRKEILRKQKAKLLKRLEAKKC